MRGVEAERGRHSRGAVELVQGEEGGGDEKFEQAGERREPRRGPRELCSGLPKQVNPQANALFLLVVYEFCIRWRKVNFLNPLSSYLI